MTITSFDHASVIVADVQTSVNFYCGLLGLVINMDRPDLGYPGAWLDVGDSSLHLLQLSNPDPVEGRPEHGGHDRHIAFRVNNLDEIEKSLAQEEISFSRSKSGRKAIFCRDPDGNGVELIE